LRANSIAASLRESVSPRYTRNEQFFPFSRGKASALITRWVNESNGFPYKKLLQLADNATRGCNGHEIDGSLSPIAPFEITRHSKSFATIEVVRDDRCPGCLPAKFASLRSSRVVSSITRCDFWFCVIRHAHIRGNTYNEFRCGNRERFLRESMVAR
jgi:hypothetical protein